MKRYQVLLFDADNTLFDFDRAERHALRESVTEAGRVFDETMFRLFHEINDGLWKQIETGEMTRTFLRTERFRLLAEKLGWEQSKAEEAGLRYVEHLGRCAFLVPGAHELCRDIARTGRYRMYIVTNGITSVQKSRFAASPLSPCFDGMFISEEIGVSKPAPAYFAHVAEATGNLPRDAYLVIGDSLTSDISGGIGAGMDTCYYAPHGSRAGNQFPQITYTIASLDDLRGILDIAETGASYDETDSGAD